MEHFIGCDAHKRYSVFSCIDERGRYGSDVRVRHQAAEFRAFLESLPPGSEIAIEAGGDYYWMADAMEQAGHHPHLAHPLEAKRRCGKTVKHTDKVDARGLAMLLRNGTLPEVWIPPAELRDERALLRLRMYLSHMRTGLKNRVHGILRQYNLLLAGSDIFGAAGREELAARLAELPPQTRRSVEEQLRLLDFLSARIEQLERRLAGILANSAETELLKTLPKVGPILSAVMALELGDIERFPGAPHVASYCGLVPRVHSSGGRTRLGATCGDVNRTLKWAFVEAANLIVMRQRRLAGTHAVRLYQRLQSKHGHQKAVVAVARHLAEAAYWVLHKQEPYREPKSAPKRLCRRDRVSAACA
ncbi:MAG TPA: IS110 family transposase [Bryobacteraceae bacterium]|nr:IS110 family transposase [Bryobacteraceae bacterium]